MKFLKYLATLALALCAITSISKAQTVMFLGGGSSALFNELGSASQAISDTNGTVTCLWSYAQTASGGSPYIAFHDGRSGVGLDENGKIWIAWGKGAGSSCASPVAPYSIYAYISLDSVVGDRCYFINDGSGSTGCTLTLTSVAGVNGTSQVSGTPDVPAASALPSAVITALSGAHSFVAGTDIRPEDAQFQIQRMFVSCNQYMPRQYFNQDSYYLFGLGYGSGPVGTTIQGAAAYNGGAAATFNVVNFSITGNDPISGKAVPGFAVSTVGAQPIIVAVAPANTGDGNIAAMHDVNGFTLTNFYQGVLGRTSDFSGAPVSGAEAVTVIVREPLSGTFNTFEYSIPNGTQYHASQEYGNCTSGGTVLSNPLSLPSGNGNVGLRVRSIGTGNVTKSLQGATTPTLGYFFWSAGNAKGLTNVKYLTVNGVDPLENQNSGSYSYTGILPGSGGTFGGHSDPGLTAVTFTGLNAGDYPIWSALRLVGPTTGNGNTGVAAMITALHTLDSTQNDYIPLNSLNVWHSHFVLNGQPALITSGAANGASVGTSTLCSGGNAEAGGDVGGSTMLIVNNAHFCSDYSNVQGLLNKTQ
jgi:hypothetical protein